MTEEEEFEQWLEDDWFTSGETSWEEYYNDADWVPLEAFMPER